MIYDTSTKSPNVSQSFRIHEISDWQLDNKNSSVELPALQRGFVWKANQIESLWDSILRGYPIGSFLLSKSEDDKLFLLDGQQRATAISLGFYNPWDKEQSFWSLKNQIPVIWVDLAPAYKTYSLKFVIRVVTGSHPWGYQRIDHTSILNLQDRRKALEIFKENPVNQNKNYVHFNNSTIFPFDSNVPVPLTFLIKSIESGNHWKDTLLELCKEKLPTRYLKTKYLDNDYIAKLNEVLKDDEIENIFIPAIQNINKLYIPGIIVEKENLKAEDENSDDATDPTLFVRLNSSGTRIAGEELIYSIYKASFPEAKELVENIGANFISPALVISLVTRLAQSEINNGDYPNPSNVNEFRKRINDADFKNKIKELIGGDINNSPSKKLFDKAIEILLSKEDLHIPPVLVKNIIKGSPDLFLMLLQWLKINDGEVSYKERKQILATITALAWFGKDNLKYVRAIWKKINTINFWSKEILCQPFINRADFIMYPLIKPETLRKYLTTSVIRNKTSWDDLYPSKNSIIIKTFKDTLNNETISKSELERTAFDVWDKFIEKLCWCKPLVLFAQKDYINKTFGDFNQMENLEDTNTPWDWDHIYPKSWIYKKKGIDEITKHWTHTIGNYRVLSLEENRSENNYYSPKHRLYDKEADIDVRQQSFILPNDWKYWSKIEDRINAGDKEMIDIHLSAIIYRITNIYAEWYNTLNVGELFCFEN